MNSELKLEENIHNPLRVVVLVCAWGAKSTTNADAVANHVHAHYTHVACSPNHGAPSGFVGSPAPISNGCRTR